VVQIGRHFHGPSSRPLSPPKLIVFSGTGRFGTQMDEKAFSQRRYGPATQQLPFLQEMLNSRMQQDRRAFSEIL
jgi:hypothetical protein